jgi:hypothetical protein
MSFRQSDEVRGRTRNLDFEISSLEMTVRCLSDRMFRKTKQQNKRIYHSYFKQSKL